MRGQVAEPLRRRESVHDDERAEFEKLRRDYGGFLRGDDDTGIQVALLADRGKEGVGQPGGGARVGEVLLQYGSNTVIRRGCHSR